MSKLVLWNCYIGLLVAGTVAGAQQPKTGALKGVVKDSTGARVPGVQVSVGAATVRTDSTGAFFVGSVAPGLDNVMFRRLAYTPALIAIEIHAEDTVAVDVTLGLAAQQLTAVVVQAGAPAPPPRVIAAFEAHRRNGNGYFITRADIDKRHPRSLADMMRVVPGAQISTDPSGRPSLHFSRISNIQCPPQFFVDGMQVFDFNIDEIGPNSIEDIEIYPGTAGLPPEYNRVHGNTVCGTVVLWTRIPG